MEALSFAVSASKAAAGCAGTTVSCASSNTTSVAERWAVPGGGDFWGAEHCSSALGARTRALHDLTRRDCLSATTEGSEASFAARAHCEKRRGVGAKRRPPQHEPLPGTARRTARNLRMR